jgi:hypothetical protein
MTNLPNIAHFRAGNTDDIRSKTHMTMGRAVRWRDDGDDARLSRVVPNCVTSQGMSNGGPHASSPVPGRGNNAQ